MVYLLLILITTFLLLTLIAKTKKVHFLLKFIIIFSYLFWHAIPVIISILDWEIFSNLSLNQINFDNYIYYASVDLLFMLLILLIFIILVRKISIEKSFLHNCHQENNIFIKLSSYFALIVLFFSVIHSLKTFGSLSYLDRNDVNYIEENSNQGIIFFFTSIAKYLLLAIILFYKKNFSKFEVILQHVVFNSYYLMSFLQGGRISLLAIFLLYLFISIKSMNRKLLYRTLLILFFSSFILPIVSRIRQQENITVSSVYKDNVDLGFKMIIDEIAYKTNSIYYSIYLLKFDGIKGAGLDIYTNTFFTLIPRAVFPNKPYPGSKDGSYLGTPSRVAGRYFNSDSDTANVGISTSIESLWAMGYIGYLITIIICSVFLFFLNNLIKSQLLLPLYFVFSMTNFPVLQIDVSPVMILRDIPRIAIISLIIIFLFKGLKTFSNICQNSLK